MARNPTPKAQQGAEDFLAHIRSMIVYWDNLPGLNQRNRLEGIAFSILVALDGGAAVGPYEVRPIDTAGRVGDDIAGTLHERLAAQNRPSRS